MATSPRKHVVPAGGETPRRQAINDLAASINDLVPVANTTERAQVINTLGWAPTPVRPLVVLRADAPSRAMLEYTINGGDWLTVGGELTLDITTFGSGWAATNAAEHKPRLRVTGNHVRLYGAVTRLPTGTGSGANLLTIPAALAPPSAGTRFISSVVTSSNQYTMLALANGVLASVYGNFVSAVGVVVPTVGDWWLD